MKKVTFQILFVLGFIQLSYAQVGVGNISPQARLDITASNQATPLNTDGLLIPRIDNFPSTSPSSAQNGMMVFLTTTVGGNVPGFYYWDQPNTQWVCISCSSAATPKHYVGELFGGGIVFYIYNDGANGLIASLDNLTTTGGSYKIKWKYNNTNTGAKSPFDGAANTLLIKTTNNSAGKLCDDYAGGGFTDWYLPAIRELQILYNNAFVIDEILENDGNAATNGFNWAPTNNEYWSSTENFDTGTSKFAYELSFFTGNIIAESKNSNIYGENYVRAIRKF